MKLYVFEVTSFEKSYSLKRYYFGTITFFIYKYTIKKYKRLIKNEDPASYNLSTNMLLKQERLISPWITCYIIEIIQISNFICPEFLLWHYYYWSILKDFNLVRNQSSNLIDRQKKLPGRHRNYGHREVAGTANDGHRKTAPAQRMILFQLQSVKTRSLYSAAG